MPGNSTVLLTRLNGDTSSTTFIDEGGNILTRTGVVFVDNPLSPFNDNCAYFNGASSLSAPATPAFNFGTGDFTIEGFFNISNNSATNANNGKYASIISNYVNGTSAVIGFGVLIGGDSTSTGTSLDFLWWTGSAWSGISAVYSFNKNQWYHFAVTRKSSTLYIFINGLLINSGTCSQNFSANTNLQIGYQALTAPNQQYFNGYMSDIHIIKGYAKYTANFTPPTTRATKYVYNANQVTATQINGLGEVNSTNILDETGKIWTSQGVYYSNANAPTHETVMHFNGSSYIKTPSHNDFNFGTEDFTVEFYMYLSASSPTRYMYLLSNNGDNGNIFAIRFGDSGYSNYFQVICGSDPGDLYSNIANFTKTSFYDAWHHVAVCRKDGVLTVYTGGVSRRSGANTSNITSTKDFTVGDSLNTSGVINNENFQGQIYGLQIIKGYAKYTAGFNVLSRRLPGQTYMFNAEVPIGRTGILLSADNGVIHDKTGKVVTTAGASVTIDNSDTWGGYPTIYQNTGYMIVPNSQTYRNFGIGDFTIEVVCKKSGILVSRNMTGLGTGAYGMQFGPKNMLWGAVYDSTSYVTASGMLTTDDNNFHHYVFMRKQGILYMFFDGVLKYQGANSENFTSASFDLQTRWDSVGGAAGTSTKYGFIRIIHSEAIYDVNGFTPPTTIPSIYGKLCLDPDNHSGYTNYGVIATTEQSKFGSKSLKFNKDSYLVVPYNSDMDFGTGDFTIHGYVYLNSNIDNYFNLMVKRVVNGSTSGAYGIEVNSYRIGWKDVLNGGTNLFGYADIPKFQWHHIAVCRKNQMLSIFLNGKCLIRKGSNTNYSNSQPMTWGNWDYGYQGGANTGFDGYMDSFQIIKGMALYDEDFVVDHSQINMGGYPHPVLLINGEVLNQDLAYHAVSSTGVSINADFTARNKYSMYTAGAGYLYINSTYGDLNFGKGDFTYEVYTYPLNTTGYRMYLYNGANKLAIYQNGTTIEAGHYGAYGITTSSNQININKWNHIAVVRKNKYLTVYLNGVPGTSVLYDVDVSFTATTYFMYNNNDTTQGFIGYTDDITMYRYAKYDGAFTPSLKENQKVGLCFIGDRLTDKVGNDYLSVYNPHPYLSKNGGAIWADGYYSNGLTYNQFNHALNGCDFTIEGDFYLNEYGTDTGIFGFRDAIASFGLASYVTSTGTIVYYIPTSASTFEVINSTSIMPLRQWVHLAYTTQNGVSKIYLDGNEIGASSTIRNRYNSGMSLNIMRLANVTTNVSNGAFNNFKITKGVNLYPSNFTPPTTYTDPQVLPSNLAFHSNCDFIGDLTGKVASANSNVTIDNSIKLDTKGSWKFGGNGYLSFPNNSMYNFGYSDFTIEFFFYLNADSPINASNIRSAWLLSNMHTTTTVSSGFGISILGNASTTGTALSFGTATGNAYYTGIDYTTTVTKQVWHHIAVCRKNGLTKLFYDGNEVASSTNINSIRSSQLLSVGFSGLTSSYQNYFNGNIQGLKIINGEALYTTNFTPIYQRASYPLDIKDPYTIMYYSGDYPADMCGNAVTNNNVAVFSDAPFGNNSLYFNGTNAYLQHSANANFLMHSDFTIDAYIKPTVLPTGSNFNRLFMFGTNGAAASFQIAILSNGVLHAGGTGGTSTFSSPSNTLTAGVWQHIRFTRSGTTAYLFVNGNQVATATNFTINFGATPTLSIGIDSTIGVAFGQRYYNGYMSAIRIQKGFSNNSSFTPSTSHLSWISSYFDHNIPDLSGKTFTNNGALISNNTCPSGQKSLLFRGEENISIPTNADFFPSTNDFCFECYVRPHFIPSVAATNDMTIFGQLYAGSVNFFFITSGSGCPAFWDGSVQHTSSVRLDKFKWYKITYSRSGYGLSIYVDGKRTYTGYCAANIVTPQTCYIGGQSADRFFHGEIAGLKYTKGNYVVTGDTIINNEALPLRDDVKNLPVSRNITDRLASSQLNKSPYVLYKLSDLGEQVNVNNGQLVTDHSGNGFHARAYGDIKPAQIYDNNCAYFGGNTSYIESVSIPALTDLSTGLTFELCICPSEAIQYSDFCAVSTPHSSYSTNDMIWISKIVNTLSYGDGIGFNRTSGTAGGNNCGTNEGYYQNEGWRHIIAIADTYGRFTLWINGRKVGYNYNFLPYFNASRDRILLGKNGNAVSTVHRFTGHMSNFALYRRPLTEEEVKSNFRAFLLQAMSFYVDISENAIADASVSDLQQTLNTIDVSLTEVCNFADTLGFNGKLNQTLEEFALANDVLEEFLLIFNKISVSMSEYVEASDVQSVIAKLNNIISEYVLASTSMEELMQTVIAVFGVITENIVVSADIDVFKKIFQLISESATVTTDLDVIQRALTVSYADVETFATIQDTLSTSLKMNVSLAEQAIITSDLEEIKRQLTQTIINMTQDVICYESWVRKRWVIGQYVENAILTSSMSELQQTIYKMYESITEYAQIVDSANQLKGKLGECIDSWTISDSSSEFWRVLTRTYYELIDSYVASSSSSFIKRVFGYSEDNYTISQDDSYWYWAGGNIIENVSFIEDLKIHKKSYAEFNETAIIASQLIYVLQIITSASDSAYISDITDRIRMLTYGMIEQAKTIDEIYCNKCVFAGVIETSLISDDDIVNSVLNALISEKALFSVRLNIHGYPVIGYVANARTGATSFYDNFNFNSFTQNNNSYFGCKGDGIYKMFESNSDAGNDIQARVTTGLVDLYTNKLKSFSDAYLVAKNDGSLYIRVMSNNEWFTYKFDKDYSENFDISRANIGRGLKSVVWQFELINDNGSDFDLEAVKLYPLILSRSVG